MLKLEKKSVAKRLSWSLNGLWYAYLGIIMSVPFSKMGSCSISQDFLVWTIVSGFGFKSLINISQVVWTLLVLDKSNVWLLKLFFWMNMFLNEVLFTHFRGIVWHHGMKVELWVPVQDSILFWFTPHFTILSPQSTVSHSLKRYTFSLNAVLLRMFTEMGAVLRNGLCVMGLMTVETRRMKRPAHPIGDRT